MKKANVAIFVPHLGCPHACSFCDQRTIAGQQAAPTPDAVRATAEVALAALGEKAKNAEIAFFGGSFTAIPQETMEALLDAAAPFVLKGDTADRPGFSGIRISTRPDAIDAHILSVLKRYGVTAIELGAQSMDDAVLAQNGRGHTRRDVETASALIRAYDFELGLQMMTGLYGSSDDQDIETARAIAACAPETVRIYPTIVLEGTQLAALYRSGLYKPPALDGAVALCARLLEFFNQQDIRVIRLGLHASRGIEQKLLAGPWHPAFRELCESEIYLKRARASLLALPLGSETLPLGSGTLPEGERAAVLYVAPSAVSKLAGQHRKNILLLEAQFNRKIIIRARAARQGEECADAYYVDAREAEQCF